MENKAIIERILKAIAQDDMLIEQFAKVVGMPEAEFSEWIDNAPVPELPSKLAVVCRETEDSELNAVSSFFSVHTAQDKAQVQVDKLTKAFGPKFIIIDAPVNP